MKYITRASALYQFLWHCNQSTLPKKVLDCGAAGKQPPLTIFHENGYDVHGIDVSLRRIKLSETFEKEQGIVLNITYGDMRELQYENNSFSFLYTYNSVFHLTKEDTMMAIDEFKRVVCSQGLIFLNVLSVDDFKYGAGEDIGDGQFQSKEGGEINIHSFYTESEADELFRDCNIIRKEKRIVEREYQGAMIRQAFIDYIVQVQ
jgi:ubiquinone/menaquinone biosynthesis C-methylase UbiE